MAFKCLKRHTRPDGSQEANPPSEKSSLPSNRMVRFVEEAGCGGCPGVPVVPPSVNAISGESNSCTLCLLTDVCDATYLSVRVNGHKIKVLLDTGASRNAVLSAFVKDDG